MTIPNNATLPVPTGWKPNSNHEALIWLGNLEVQLGSTMDRLPEDNVIKAELYVAMQIIAKIENIVNSP